MSLYEFKRHSEARQLIVKRPTPFFLTTPGRFDLIRTPLWTPKQSQSPEYSGNLDFKEGGPINAQCKSTCSFSAIRALKACAKWRAMSPPSNLFL